LVEFFFFFFNSEKKYDCKHVVNVKELILGEPFLKHWMWQMKTSTIGKRTTF